MARHKCRVAAIPSGGMQCRARGRVHGSRCSCKHACWRRIRPAEGWRKRSHRLAHRHIGQAHPLILRQYMW